MIDTKSKLILSILARECQNGNYHIVEISDIILSLPRHFRMDTETVKHILTYLERQDIISIKYDDDQTYCLAILPYGFEILENIKTKSPKQIKEKNKPKFFNLLCVFLSAFLGAFLGIIISFYLLKLF
jgi:stalled ribosome rescue protein Dom34